MFYESTRRIALYTTDVLWMEHIEAMDYLRSSVNLRAYGQREPIVEYKKDGLRMFKEMEEDFHGQVLSLIHTLEKPLAPEPASSQEALIEAHQEPKEFTSSLIERTSTNSSEVKAVKEEVGRNDPCPCGSGKKYKKCHGA